MKRIGWLCLFGLALSACDGGGRPGTGRTDSESHWLEPCTTDAECGSVGELSCLCGMCARTCTPAGSECRGLGAEAACLVLPPACGGAISACTRPCDMAAQCGGEHLSCEGGACAPVAGRPDAGPDVDMARPADMSMDMAVLPTDMTPPVDMVVLPVDMTLDGTVDMAADLGPPTITRLPDGPGCLADAECPGGYCQAEGRDAQDQLCDAPEPMANVCQAEVCANDGDCGLARRCVRAGEFGHARSACVPSRCMGDADCGGGRCLGFFTYCHNGGFACAGDADTCRVDADCPQRGAVRVCLPREGGGTECVAIE